MARTRGETDSKERLLTPSGRSISVFRRLLLGRFQDLADVSMGQGKTGYDILGMSRVVCHRRSS